MVIKNIDRAIATSEAENEIIKFLNETIDVVNLILNQGDRWEAKEINDCSINDIVGQGNYYGKCGNNSSGVSIKDLPSGVNEFSLLVYPTQNSIIQIIITNESNIFIRSITKKLDEEFVIGDWKEL